MTKQRKLYGYSIEWHIPNGLNLFDELWPYARNFNSKPDLMIAARAHIRSKYGRNDFSIQSITPVYE